MSHIWSKEYDDKLRQRIAELEADRDRVMRENGKLNCHIDDLEEENKRLNDLCADRQKWRSRMGLKTTDDVVKENNRLLDCAEKAANALVLEMPDAAMSYIKQALEETP